MIQVSEVLDPFRPGTERRLISVEYESGMSVADALLAAGIDPQKHIAILYGEVVTPEEMEARFVGDETSIIASPRVAGGLFP